MRKWLPSTAATEHSKELSKAEVTQIFDWYKDELKKDLRPDQQGKKPSYYKGCTETKMRSKAGSVFVANAIWTIGLPRLPPLATEQRPLSVTDLQAVPEAIQNVLEWLDRIGSACLSHLSTKEYAEALRTSGTMHGKSGLCYRARDKSGHSQSKN